MKREPTLLDEYLIRPKKFSFGPSELKLLSAHKFVLDLDASEFLGELLHRAALEVLQEHEFARAPYDLTWVEFNHRSYMKGLHAKYLAPEEVSDYRLGLLFDHGTVWQIVGGDDHSKLPPFVSPYKFHLHQPINFQQELALAQDLGTSRLMLRGMLMGVVNSDGHWFETKAAADICRSHRVELIRKDVFANMTPEQWNKVITDGAGSLKCVIALGLLLSRPGKYILNQTDIGHRRQIWKGKNAVFKAHHVLSLRLEYKDPILRFTRHLSTGLHRRRHGVKGHWAQTRAMHTRNCSHYWIALDPDHWECHNCGAKRWWRIAHMRGDSTIGLVTKEYNVTR